MLREASWPESILWMQDVDEEGAYANGHVTIQPLPEAVFGQHSRKTLSLRRIEGKVTEEEQEDHCSKELLKVQSSKISQKTSHLQVSSEVEYRYRPLLCDSKALYISRCHRAFSCSQGHLIQPKRQDLKCLEQQSVFSMDLGRRLSKAILQAKSNPIACASGFGSARQVCSLSCGLADLLL